MVVFSCAGCGAVMTVRVARVALPDHAGQKYGHDLLSGLLEPGTYAVDPGDGRPWHTLQPEPEEHGVRLLTYCISGPPDRIGIAPSDVRGTVFIPERLGGCCCGWDGQYGPNLACAECGRPVATRVDDCGFWQVVWLEPDAVRPVAVAGPVQRMMDWEELPSAPPVDPRGYWSPQWRAAVAVALAHLLVVSGGKRVAVPDGPVAEVFRRAIDSLLPLGKPERHLILAGPGLSPAIMDIALVPRHPQTGEVWPCEAGAVVPLAADVWAYLAFHDDRRLVPAAYGMPVGLRRDDPPPLLPHSLFRPDGRVFLSTLERLAAFRQPWLRRIYEQMKDRPYMDPFA
ncbi:hypothetical protein FH608_049335 [Nonomuraea phyllanthi]|uniref:Uncharacterized protein n=1 Tax=Nonomuraea phyllanthi TaxID=2219224 RepID=A0A5C4UWQ8_9ACTN|nr:hypothetical protein [Nonomuraea phyllanthi]KAB8183263.1 hypothetical protein FH608_049335 [Nonomuraea phyllanthi]